MRTPTSRPLARALCVAAATTMLGTLAVATPSVAAPSDGPTSKAPMTTIRGTVVRAGNGNPVPGVLVTIRDVGDEIGDLEVIASGTTNARGVYRIDVRSQDEYNIKFNGRAKGFETGFLACSNGGSAAVVPTWGEACSHGDGLQPKARLQKL